MVPEPLDSAGRCNLLATTFNTPHGHLDSEATTGVNPKMILVEAIDSLIR